MADRGRRALAVILLGAALLATEAGGAERVDVRANVSFQRRDAEFSRVRLTIKRDGTTWRSGFLGKSYFIAPKVRVRDLDADGEPEVWVDRYTGGAHCCLESRFFRWLPRRRAYARTFHGWADVGYRLRNVDRQGAVELVSADARFAYVFTSFADSAFPIRIWEFDRGRLRDVTRRFPARVEADAQAHWRDYLRRRRSGDVRGVLAAWLADQYLLGREDAGWEALTTALRRGDLEGPNGIWPTGRRYLRELRAFLVKTGYAPRAR
ncbi:MAG TPA: hypothetical protein VFR32_02795 [Gaiellaceae bacterium]|nr:hypothetical protein [Gaiellaceae bacterium]